MTPPSATLLRRADAHEVARALRDAPVAAVDTEFHTERRYWPELLLVQIHVPGHGIHLVDPLDDGVMEAIAEPLGGVATWIVHGGRQDLRLLRRVFGRVPPQVLDTQVAAGLAEGVGRSGLDALLGRFLGRPMCKAVRMADWSQRPLPPEQLAYAAEDVRWLPDLWAVVERRVLDLGRGEALAAACQEARSEALDADPVEDAFRSATREVDLDPEDAGPLRALLAWRDAVAEREDRPPAFVLGDATLRELAHVRPTTPEALARHRRLGPRTVARHGRDILQAIHAGAGGRGEPPRARSGTPAARRLAWLELFAAHLGAQRAIAPQLVMPRARLEPLACATSPGRDEVRAALGVWRDLLVGADLTEALAGDLALALAPEDVHLHRADRFRDKGDPY